MVHSFRVCVFLLALLWRSLVVNHPLARADNEPVTVATLEQQVYELVNNHRTAIGLAPLAYNTDIARIAREHSRNMASGYVGVGHAGADERGRTLAQTITYKQFAENVAVNSYGGASPAQEVLSSWLGSSGHRANIEGTFDVTGVGIARSGNAFFFTQIFLTTARSSRTTVTSLRPRNHTSEREYSEIPEQPRSSSQPRRVETAADQEERDPRKRPGRKRVRGGYVQDLEEDH